MILVCLQSSENQVIALKLFLGITTNLFLFCKVYLKVRESQKHSWAEWPKGKCGREGFLLSSCVREESVGSLPMPGFSLAWEEEWLHDTARERGHNLG